MNKYSLASLFFLYNLKNNLKKMTEPTQEFSHHFFLHVRAILGENAAEVEAFVNIFIIRFRGIFHFRYQFLAAAVNSLAIGGTAER